MSEALKYSDVDIAWLSGIIDGEGNLGIWKSKGKTLRLSKRGFRWSMAGGIGNTNIILMEKVEKIIKNIVYTGCSNLTKYKNNKYDNRKAAFLIRLSPNALRIILPLCLPYLTAKKNQAEILIKALVLCSKHTLCINNDKKMESLYQQLKILNKKGV